MNPFVALFLTVIIVTIGLMLLRLFLTWLVANAIARRVDVRTVSPDEIVSMAHQYWMARLAQIIHPLAFWWVYLPAIVWFVCFRKRGQS